MTSTTAAQKNEARVVQKPFNDDLLVNEDFRETVRQAFPAVFHVLDFEELRQEFYFHERNAKQARLWLFRVGISSVISATLVLILLHAASSWSPADVTGHILIIGLKLVSLIVVTIGGGLLLTGGLRHRWLMSRMAAERIRQWHFQFMLFHIEALLISCSDEPNAQQHFAGTRHKLFKTFNDELKRTTHAKLTQILDSFGLDSLWFSDPNKPNSAQLQSGEELSQFLDAYQLLRFDHQLTFTNTKLEKGTELPIWSFLSWPPLVQQTRLERGATALLGISVLLTLASIALHFNIIPKDTSDVITAVALACAYIGLALGAIAKGLGIDREIERYQEYRYEITEAKRLFLSTDDPKSRRAGMLALEKASMREMAAFLKAHNSNSWSIG
jgi:hypothetical protein